MVETSRLGHASLSDLMSAIVYDGLVFTSTFTKQTHFKCRDDVRMTILIAKRLLVQKVFCFLSISALWTADFQ